jgi:hypothetical protein
LNKGGFLAHRNDEGVQIASLGYEGSYNRVAAFARAWKEACRQLQQTAGRETFVPLAFAPGEAFQFDWSEDFAIIGGVRFKLQVAHFKLSGVTITKPANFNLKSPSH